MFSMPLFLLRHCIMRPEYFLDVVDLGNRMLVDN